ncbi:MAG TPA: hypothetical protein VGP72_05085 [Planctomycetota bacterium]|jgi:E3 ubiquitin-protein ligase DOA10
MLRKTWLLLAVLVLALGTTQLRAADGAGRTRGQVPMTMEQINERLGADNALTDEQKKKVQAVNEEFTKKMEEANKKEGVAEAQAEIKKARDANDREAIGAAYKKLTEKMGFNAREEYKKALTPALNEAQVAKLFPARRAPGGEEKKAQ